MLPFATTYRKQTSYRELSKNFWDTVIIMVRAKDTLWALAIWVGQGWWLTQPPAGLSRVGAVSTVSPPSLQPQCSSCAISDGRNHAFPEGRLPRPECGQHSLGTCFLFSVSGISSKGSFDFGVYRSFVLCLIKAGPGRQIPRWAWQVCEEKWFPEGGPRGARDLDICQSGWFRFSV